jgi:hypothetical protein
MQITVTIPDVFAAQVKARGQEPQSYVESLIDHAAQLAPAKPKPFRSDSEMQAFFREMAANSENLPQLPDEAFTRESLYQDHDG